jgi:predicted RNA-binding protein with PUA-like domain
MRSDSFWQHPEARRIMDLTLDGIEGKVETALCKLDKQPGPWPAPKCTRAVKNAIGHIGEKLGFVVYAAGCCYEKNGEWLYDLCWCNESGSELKEMALAAESEWSPARDEILTDFQKLLVSRANLRVFLCCQEEPDDWTDCEQYLFQQIHDYCGTQIGDRYLFGNWTSRGWKFTRYVHPTKVPVVERVWLFQATGRYDLSEELKRLKGDYWLPKRYHDRLRIDNIVLFWQAGTKAGIYGLGKLTKECYEKDGKMRVDVQYRALLNEPILKPELRQHPLLKNTDILRYPRGTVFRVRDEEWQALKKAFPQIGSAART